MNAPRTSGNGGREPFLAFTCDDALRDVIRNVAVAMGWAGEKCQRGNLHAAIKSLAVSSSPKILVIDLSESNDPLEELNGLAEVVEPGTQVIALGQFNDVRLYRELLNSGIHDYLLKPLDHDTLQQSLINLQNYSTYQPENEAGAHKHWTVVVTGVRGGVGASSLATSLAWEFSSRFQRNTGLLDLDLHFGTGALMLDLEPGRGLIDALENPGRIDGLFIERAMVKAHERLSLLSGEASLSGPPIHKGEAMFQLKNEFANLFEVTVADIPRQVMIEYPDIARNTELIILTVELTLASARDTIRMLAWLKGNVPSANILMVANKVQAGQMEISRSDFESSIERKIDFIIPFELKAVCHAAKMGQAITNASESYKMSNIIANIADRCVVLGDGGEEALANSRLSKGVPLLDGLKSLFSKKKETEKA